MITVQWLASVLLLYGLFEIGRKKLRGVYACTAAEALWLWWGIATHAWGLAAMSGVLLLVYLVGFRKWRDP